ncbi:MAG: glycoside hydrolase family 97 N-terminal domain-containing protein [Chitinophagaceae bacterium]|nr:glycoside hydrolase family 97 N-terminal domain-containing protein [Chitinophagaceae bacterium]
MKKSLVYYVSIVAGILLCVTEIAQNNNFRNHWITTFPYGNNDITILHQSGQIFYFIKQQNDTVINKSLLGTETKDADFSNGLIYPSVTTQKTDEQYTILIGKRRLNQNLCNQTRITFTYKNYESIQFITRAYNDGAAFRYYFPAIKKDTTVANENLSFISAWLMQYGKPTDHAQAYENYYGPASPIIHNAPDSSNWAFPALVNSSDDYILLTEAGISEIFYGTHLKK